MLCNNSYALNGSAHGSKQMNSPDRSAALAHYTAQAVIARQMIPLAAPTKVGTEEVVSAWGHNWTVRVERDEDGAFISDVQIDGVWMSALEVLNPCLIDALNGAAPWHPKRGGL